MREQLRKNLIRTLLPLGLSILVFLILLCGLSQATEARSRAVSMETARDWNRLGSVAYESGVPACQQTENLVPNSGFEQGIGCPNHWCEGGDCVFQTDESAHSGATSARISAASVRGDGCLLFSPMDEIRVEGGRFYDYSAWIKTSALEGEAYLRVTFWSRQGDPPAWAWEGEGLTNSVTDTQGAWDRVTGSVQAPPDAEYARIEATLPDSSVGSVWFDDVFLGLATCLNCSKRAEPDPVSPGQMLTYTIVCSNTGREKATNVEVVETFDPYIHFERAQPPPYVSPNLWKFPELLPGTGITITLVVQVKNDTGERAWLFNTVQIDSDEVVWPAAITISTSLAISTETCAVLLEPLQQSASGSPGQATEYNLCLWNVGSCDRALDMEFASSRWGIVDVTPSPPYSLPPGSSMSLTMSSVMPQDVSCADVDVTHITATLACGSPCNRTATATATVTTTVTCPIFLPTVMRDYEGCFPGPWEVEPNDCYYEANGPLCPDREYYGYLNDSWDCFSVDLPINGQITADLMITGCQGVQLQLRDEGYSLLEYVWGPPYHIEYVGLAGRYYVCVYAELASHCEMPYTLRAAFP